MKSTHKHELQTNELADALGRAITWAKPHAQTIALVAAAVIVVVFALVVMPALRGSAGEVAAAAFALAQNSGQTQPLHDFLDDYPKAPQAPTARLLLADRLLRETVSSSNPTGNPLTEARKQYAEVEKSSELLRPLAKVGLALVTIQEGDLKKGREALQEVVSKWPQSIAAEKARSHIEALAGYMPLVFSNEPLEEPKAPAEAETETTKPKEGEGEKEPAPEQPGAEKPAEPPTENKTPETKPAPKATGEQQKKGPKPVG
ncbi:MAG TPA: hypothetical protein VM238_22060 [Phycisphaerae bacterium]|nr:hypothetical protein [Phycisphaerae bacterium]